MPDQATLEALRDGFWPLYVTAITAASLSVVLTRRWCLGRAVVALVLGSVAQWAWEGTGYLAWWQHLAIDVVVLAAVTAPPRHYWQATLGALIFAQIFLHAVWGGASIVLGADMAREHWVGVIGLGYAKCLVLLLWAGGARVERVLDRIARRATDLVLAATDGKLA